MIPLRAIARPVAVAAAAAAMALGAMPRASAAPVTLDRTVARFIDPEASEAAGAGRFVMMRELVIEAWLVAYERTPNGSPPGFDDKHLRAALERHVIEEILGDRALFPASEKKVPAAIGEALRVEEIAVGGERRLREALERASGSPTGATVEMNAIVRRRARAELYLEDAVAQPVQLSEAELRAGHTKAPDLLATMKYEDAIPLLRAWLRAGRLRDAAQGYYQAVRARLHLEIVQG